MFLTTVIACTLLAGLIYASTFEWAFHRYIMHRPAGAFRYPFDTHTRTHHRVFKADRSYHVQDPADRKWIPMAWWNGIALVTLNSIPAALCGLPFILLGYLDSFVAILATTVTLFSVYYGVYEYLHWCMHLPKSRRVERSRIFRRLNGHHLLHHRYMNKNFNVVFPFADAVFGTLITRSKTFFAQARGDAVPDVQPVPA